MTQPRPPENVRLVRPDGSVLPVELVYAGQDEDGIHEWVAVATSPTIEEGTRLFCDVLPARTAINVKIDPRLARP